MPKQPTQGKKGKGCVIGCAVFLVVLILFFGGVEIFRRRIITTKIDKNAFQAYERTPEIIDIAEKLALTDKGKDIFYKAEPRIVNATSFAKFCKTAVRGVESLACYINKPYGGPFSGLVIFLLDIDDPRFADHKYSAAAHEMLHVVYKRLGSKEKTSLNSLLSQEWENHRADTHLQATRAQMEKNGKGEKEYIEEMHSKFGVEYKDLSPELEAHYALYFADRQTVVALYSKGGFGSRLRQIDELNSELASLKERIIASKNNDLVGQYNIKVNQINAYIADIREFYSLFNPDHKPLEQQEQ